jgi:hypothetical protein
MSKNMNQVLPSIWCLILLLLSGCATQTVERNENEKIVERPDTQRRPVKKEYSISSLILDDVSKKISGSVSVSNTTALLVSEEKHYDTISYTKRNRLAIEGVAYYVFNSEPMTCEKIDTPAKAIGECIARPWIGVFGGIGAMVCFPFEVLNWDGYAHVLLGPGGFTAVNKVDEVAYEWTNEVRKKKVEPISSHNSYQKTEQSIAPNIPVITKHGERSITDSAGRFSLQFSFPKGTVSKKMAREQAANTLRSIFLEEVDVVRFLDSASYMKSTFEEVVISTDAKSIVSGWNEKMIITEGNSSISVSGFEFDEQQLMSSLRDYLHEVALSAIDVTEVDVTIEVRDAISRTPTRGQTSISLELTEGVTPDVMNNQMLAALRKIIQPAYVRRYLPPESDLPRIRQLPANCTVAGEKRFRVHVPATYKIKAAHPDYVYVEGKKSFAMNSRTATIYMDDKGSKQRVSIQDGSAQAGRIE